MTYRDIIQNLDVFIDGRSVNLVHEVVFVPLVYSRLTEMSMTKVQEKSRVNNQVFNQSYSRFQEYNLLAKKP